jgi:MFS transporter, DHA1 family, tetracycline resistance protein
VPGSQKAALAFIFVTVALDVLALGIVIPVLPKLVTEFLGGDLQRAAVLFAWFVTAWEGTQFLCSPLLGALSDRFGRRPLILLSNLGLGLDYVLMALAPSLPWLWVGRIISGLTAASFPVASAYVADVMPPEKRAAGFGMIGAAFGLGFVVGPALGGFLGGFHPRLPFWVAAGFSLANAAYGAFVLPESLPKEQRMAFSWARANPLGSLKLLRSHPELLGLSLAAFAMNLAHFSLQSTFVLFADYRFGWKERAVGFTLAGVGVCAAVVQGGLAGPVAQKLGDKRTLLVGLVFGALGFACYGLAPTGLLFLVGVPIMSLWGLASPASQALMSRRIGPSEQGQLQGALTSLSAVAGIIAPPILNGAFAWAIDPQRTLAVPGTPFLLSAGLLLVALGIAVAATRDPSAAQAS